MAGAEAVPAVIVAGGRARRMGGGDKLLLPLGAGTVLDAILDRLGEARPVAVNAGGDARRFAPLPVLPDLVLRGVEDRPGPLAGLLAATEWARGQGAALVLTVPGDAPFLPRDLLPRLLAAGAPAVAASGGRLQPIVGLWPTGAASGLREALEGGIRRAEAAARLLGAAVVEFPTPREGPDPFSNLNTPEDHAAARAWAG